MTLEKLLQDVHRAAEEKARIDTCVELYLEGNLPLIIACLLYTSPSPRDTR